MSALLLGQMGEKLSTTGAFHAMGRIDTLSVSLVNEETRCLCQHQIIQNGGARKESPQRCTSYVSNS